MDFLVVGTGYAGSVCARILAERSSKSVRMIDRRDHIAGNMYDSYNKDGILVHWYGPHIASMNEQRVFDFLSRFTDWVPYHHRVNAEIDGVEVPLPINLNSIDLLFSVKKALQIKNALIESYGFDSNVPILQMKKSSNPMVSEFADYVFEKVFLHYTMKMWGLRPEEIDPSVTARIPVRVSYDDRHFLQKYQVMPKEGYTKLFQKMLDLPNIEVSLNTPARELLQLDEDTGKITVGGKVFTGVVIYTGALDELFDWNLGELPYRSLQFEFATYAQDYIQESTVLNWPDERPATRRTEMKRLTGQKKKGVTSTIVEYPGAYRRGAERFGEPLYPINNEMCNMLYAKYKKRLAKFPQIIPVGRLADYRYYNMEATIIRAMDVADQILRK